MKHPVNICVTVFNRYDLLARLVDSLRFSQVVPRTLRIIDRGNDKERLGQAVGVGVKGCETIYVPLGGQSLAAAWNWFINYVPEERILVSDDVIFFPETIGEFISTPGPFVGLKDGRSSYFSCFLIRDACVSKVGLFDEHISPDYLYFEDCDYGHRMKINGLSIAGVERVYHEQSASLKQKTPAQIEEHHRRFRIAESNYHRKWGGPPVKAEHESM